MSGDFSLHINLDSSRLLFENRLEDQPPLGHQTCTVSPAQRHSSSRLVRSMNKEGLQKAMPYLLLHDSSMHIMQIDVFM